MKMRLLVIKDEALNHSGLIKAQFPLEESLLVAIEKSDWSSIDRYFLEEEKPGGKLFAFLSQFLEFKSIEHIISIREVPDEDGIWHDDGSRILGFTLSITKDHSSVKGGHLLFKRKGEHEALSLPLQPMGTMLLFKTGIYGYEHMVTEVTEGKRILIAGWCS